MNRPVRAITGLLAILAVSCAGDIPETPADSDDPAAMPGSPDKPRPRASDVVGTAVRTWVVDDASGAALGLALAPLAALPANADPLPSYAQLRDRLARAGVRLVVAPRDRVAQTLEALDAVADAPERVLSPSSTWSAVCAGPSWAVARDLILPDGEITVAPGRLRLLARGWATPWAPRDDGTIPAGLRLDLLVQHEEHAVGGMGSLTLEPPRLRPIEDIGHLFRTLAVETALGPGEVLLVVPEQPGVDWNALKPDDVITLDSRPRAPGDPGPIENGIDAPPPPIDRVNFPDPEPDRPRPRTIGSALLTDAQGVKPARRRLVVVFEPRLPDNYSLIR